MDKSYSRINWENQPSTATALGATNLNKIDIALNEVDDRVIHLDNIKLDKDTGNTMVQTVELNPDTGILTVKQLDGSTATYDLDIEKVAVNFYMNEDDQLILVNGDGTERIIDLAKFIDTYVFYDTGTIAFTNANKSITAVVKKGSITNDELQGDYLGDITEQALNAHGSAGEAQQSALTSKRYAVGGVVPEDAEDNAKYYKERAEFYAGYAEQVADVGIASEAKLGLIRGNGDLRVSDDGTPSIHTDFQAYTGDNPAITSGDSFSDILGKMAGVQAQIGSLTFFVQDGILCIGYEKE